MRERERREKRERERESERERFEMCVTAAAVSKSGEGGLALLWGLSPRLSGVPAEFSGAGLGGNQKYIGLFST